MARRLSPAAGRRWDGSLLVVLLRVGYGLSRPAAAAFHRGGDPEAALSAAGAPDDGTLLGEEPGAGTWPRYLLACPCLAQLAPTSRIRGRDRTRQNPLVSLGSSGQAGRGKG